MTPFKPLTLSDKPTFDLYLTPFNPRASELSFTNLYMWRRKYGFQYAVLEGFLWVLNISSTGKWYFSPPIGDYSRDPRPSVEALRTFLAQQGRDLVIKKADKAVAEALTSLYTDSIAVLEMRPDFDYLYDFEALKTLKGNKLHKKRNHLNKFLKTYPDWRYEDLNGTNIPEVKLCLDRWCQLHDCSSDPDLAQERTAIEDALAHWDALNFNGGLIRIGGTVEAFTFAEKLNTETTVIHIEKADPNIDGLYTAINQKYLEHCSAPTSLVNREQDMGLPGLQKAKESYQPVGFVEKFMLTFNPL